MRKRVSLLAVVGSGSAVALSAMAAGPATADTNADSLTEAIRLAGETLQGNSGAPKRLRAMRTALKPIMPGGDPLGLGPVITLFDLPADQAAFDAAILAAGGTLKANLNWDDDFDYGIIGGAAPITSAGNGFVSPGVVPDNMTIDANWLDDNNGQNNGAGGRGNRGGGNEVVGVGPSAGFGTTGNAVLANYFVDSYDVWFSTSTVAMEFSPLSLLGGNTVDIAVYGTEDDITPLIIFPATSAIPGFERYGIVRTDGGTIGRLNLEDPLSAGGSGAEGTEGIFVKYDAAAGTCADTFVLVNGIENSGAFGDTCGSDDVRWTLSSTTFDAVFSPAPINLEVTGNVGAGGATLTFTMEGHPTFGGGTAFITVALFNYSSGLFEQSVFAGQADGPPDAVYSKTVDNTAGNYVDVDGSVRARITGAKTAAGPVRLNIDDMFWD